MFVVCLLGSRWTLSTNAVLQKDDDTYLLIHPETQKSKSRGILLAFHILVPLGNCPHDLHHQVGSFLDVGFELGD